jgi:hypothetical protein
MVFKRRDPDADIPWWDDVRAAARDPEPKAAGQALWRYLSDLRGEPDALHLPVLRVLDILAWAHVKKYKTGH